MFLLFALLFLVIAIGGLTLAATWRPRLATAQAAALLVLTILLVLYAASEDSYRRGGISRWDAYGAKGFVTFAVVTGLVVAAALVVAHFAKPSRLGRVAALASAAAAALQVMAFVALTVN